MQGILVSDGKRRHTAELIFGDQRKSLLRQKQDNFAADDAA